MASCTAVDSTRLRLGERARRHDAARLADPGGLTEGRQGVARELERVYSGDRAEKIVRERKFLQVAEPQFGVGDAVAAAVSRPGLTSSPVTVAPRAAAIASSRPLPQPASSSRVPAVTEVAASTASNSGRVCGSANRAHPVGSTPPQLLLLAGGGGQRAFAPRRHDPARGLPAAMTEPAAPAGLRDLITKLNGM